MLQKTLMRIFAFAFFVLATMYSFSFVQAQSTQDFVGPNGIKEIKEKVYYEVLPTKPRVGDTVDISTEMYGTPVKDAYFTWYIDGKEYEKGIGRSKISFYLSKKTNVSVKIITGPGYPAENSWTFNPQNTVIIWEANTYTPPFYKGKSLYTAESGLILNAINLSAKNPLTNTYNNYIWKVDGSVKGDNSGVAQNTYLYQGDILMQEPYFEVIMQGVSAYRNGKQDLSDESLIDSSAAIRVPTLETTVFTYENSPLLGILFDKQVTNNIFRFNKSETSLVVYPGYFSVPSTLNMGYEWTINDDVVKRNVNSITFKKIRDDEQSRLSISLSNPKALLQSKDISYIIDTSK